MHWLKRKELAVIFAVSLLIGAAIHIGNFYLTPAGIFFFSLLLIVTGLNIVAYLMPWVGRGSLFLFLIALFTFPSDDIGVTSLSKVIVFLLAGLTFELSFMYLKLHLHSIPLDIVVGSSLAMAVLPLSSAFFLSPSLASSFPPELWNLTLLAFSIGLGTSVLMSLLWEFTEHTKLVLELYFFVRR